MEEKEQSEEKSSSEVLDTQFKNLLRSDHPIKPKRIGAKRTVKSIAMVIWEDITAYTRVEIPDDFEIFRLTKLTVGLLWKESKDYLVLIQDYDLSNRGKGYRHNDFHIIPRGAIKEIRLLGEVEL